MKKIIWMNDSLKCLKRFPEAVQDIFGYSLFKAQKDIPLRNSKTLKGFKPAVIEIVVIYDTNTYRAIYTAKIGAILINEQ